MRDNNQISAGNFIISISEKDSREVAIYSKSSGRFVSQNKQTLKRSWRLRKVKRELGVFLNAKDAFTFSYMPPHMIEHLENILKSKR